MDKQRNFIERTIQPFIEYIVNKEIGYSVRSKLNAVIHFIKNIAATKEDVERNRIPYYRSIETLYKERDDAPEGSQAWVGVPYPGKVWVMESGMWKPTNVTPPAAEVNLEEYSKNGGSLKTNKELDTSITNLENITESGEGSIAFIPGYYLNTNYGTTSHEDYSSTDYISVTKDTEIYYSGYVGNAAFAAVGYLNRFGVDPIVLIGANQNLSNCKLVIPDGVRFIRLCGRHKVLENVHLSLVNARIFRSVLSEFRKISNSFINMSFPTRFKNKNLYAKSGIGAFAINNASPGDIIQLRDGQEKYKGIIIPFEPLLEYVISGYNIPNGKTVTIFDANLQPIETRNQASPYTGDNIKIVGNDWSKDADIVISNPENGAYIGFNVAHTNFPNYYKTAKIQVEKGNVSTPYIKGAGGLLGYLTLDDLGEITNGITKIEFVQNFNIRIPINIYKQKNIYYSDFDVKKNMLSGSDTFYLSPDGSDGNNGKTPLAPFKTLKKARDSGTDNGTIVFLEGTYLAGVNFDRFQNISKRNLIGIGNVIVDNLQGDPIKLVGSVYIENIEFINGTQGSLLCSIQNNVDVITCYKCKFNYSIGEASQGGSYGGFQAQGGNYYMVDCESSYNYSDGFNYHESNPQYMPHIVEINCKGFFNGSLPVAATYHSMNGSTIHAGAKAIRLNCEYGYCHGGIIADVNPSTMSYNIGCVAYSSTVKDSKLDFSSNFYCGSEAVMYLIGCKSSGSLYDISVATSGTVYTDDLFENNYNSNGTIKQIFN